MREEEGPTATTSKTHVAMHHHKWPIQHAAAGMTKLPRTPKTTIEPAAEHLQYCIIALAFSATVYPVRTALQDRRRRKSSNIKPQQNHKPRFFVLPF
jgi:hypothetical protein